MNVNQIIQSVESLTDNTYDTSTWLDWINFCLDDLSQVAKKPGRKEISCSAGVLEYVIPSGIHEIFGAIYTSGSTSTALRCLNPLDIYSKGWKYLDKIVLQGVTPIIGDKISLNCYVSYADVTTLTDTPELEPQYHELIVLYLASRSQQKEEDMESRLDYYKEYLDRRKQFEEVRLRQAEPWRKSVKNSVK